MRYAIVNGIVVPVRSVKELDRAAEEIHDANR